MTVATPSPSASVEKAEDGRFLLDFNLLAMTEPAPEPTIDLSKAPLRVAFVGQAGTGKTTHAQLLRAAYKGDVLSFATPLKKLTRDLFGDLMDSPQFARTANQEFGVLARRLAGPNIWVSKLLEKIPNSRNTFVDDCRFMSEYNALRTYGFVVIKLYAPPTVLAARRPELTRDQWEHESERDIQFLHADLVVDTATKSEQEVHQTIREYLTSDAGRAARQRWMGPIAPTSRN